MKQFISFIFASFVGAAIAIMYSSKTADYTNNEPVVVKTSVQNNTLPEITKRKVTHSATSTQPVDFVAAAEAAMPAVVNITSITEYKPKNSREERFYRYFGTPKPSEATGSGVIVSENGYIVTNNHVIKEATTLEVTLLDNRKFIAKVIGKDPSTDLAVIKIEAPDLPVIELANSDESKVGQWVLAVGNPYELTSTVTAGIISAKGRDISILNGQYSIESFIQTDAAVNPGNSGGALVDTEGRLIGINTAIYAPTGTYAGYSFAVPINLAKKVMQDLIDYGEVKRGYLGVMIRDVNSDFAKANGLDVTEGIYVTELIEGGAAISSGIKEGDVITEVNGKKTNSVPQLQEQIGSRNPGDSVIVTVNRKGINKKVNVTLRE